MISFRVLVLSALLTLTLDLQARESLIPTNSEKVRLFVAAFNAQDSQAMASFVVDDIEWLSITGASIAVEAKGKDNLIDSMDSYFKSCSTCRSELSDMFSTGQRVSAVEIASWQGSSGPRSQSAISVYEFLNGKIARVYYFAAQE